MQAPILQQLAFLDAVTIAEERPAGAWRRQQVFADESGASWRAIADPCTLEVGNLFNRWSRWVPAMSERGWCTRCAFQLDCLGKPGSSGFRAADVHPAEMLQRAACYAIGLICGVRDRGGN